MLRFNSIVFIFSIFCTCALGSMSTANDVFTAQRLLTELGYDPGPIDGAYGGKTKKALIK